MSQVPGSDDDDAPAERLKALAAKHVSLPLASITLVVPAVVLDDDPPSLQHEIATSDELTVSIDEVGVALGLRQSGPHHDEPDNRLARRLDTVAHVPQQPPGATDSVEVPRIRVGDQAIESRLSGRDQVVAELHHFHDGPSVRAVDERAIWTGDGKPIDHLGMKMASAPMQNDASVFGHQAGIRRELQRCVGV